MTYDPLEPMTGSGTPLTVGSVCTGYGGLDLAVCAVLGARPAWVADPNPGAARILAHRFPRVPNLGDITAVNWDTTPPVDILTAGFPCQDLSYAGRGAGIKEGTRSGLWLTIAHALGVLRPRLIVLENVAAIVARRPGLDIVAADLAALGFDAEWTCVRASDVGAPHRRERWFCLAWPADPGSPRLEGGRLRDAHDVGGHWGWPRRPGRDEPAAHGLPAAYAPRIGAGEPADQAHPVAGGWTPWPVPGCGSGRAAADPDQSRQRAHESDLRAGQPDSDWGDYGPAILRWEAITGRAAPRPTDHRRRLTPVFVEWLMGLPPGWVTDTPGLTRNQQLHALGNGVLPAQAIAALHALLPAYEQATATLGVAS
ncbi:DNA cytosine methyltransferase [Nonomuraea sp. NPDC049607]|uniref:DNA cytosine methyltransferase n=1 Tax=Nonomuraea sp. NPDC049607 TaxID=3154732 RepID=UPI0034210BCA